jgi:hypothetical protein
LEFRENRNMVILLTRQGYVTIGFVSCFVDFQQKTLDKFLGV